VGVVLPQPIQFGKYTLFERIGRGGMADVFKGRVQGPAGFERVFVVKRILPHLSDDPQFTKMFIEEAKLSARLNHPNIVQVFELGAVDKEYFIAMEHVKGRDLAETMRTLWARVGPPRPELVSYIGREMCRALAYAHDHTADDGSPVGMIHRDVSPSNVMLSYEGAVKILDFGIAKALGGKDAPEESNTQRGTLKGKFAYMAPEQTTGSDVDKRIDIFATGIVLHEVLTGRRLFKGENDLQTVERVRVCDVPPPSLQNPLCPPELDAIVLKALARNREERFQTAADMADALDDVVHAARFQPGHLAQLMRDLFPTDAGVPVSATSASGRVSSQLSGSQSRPHSAALRSPTVPPVALPRSTASGRALPVRSDALAEHAARKKPFLSRGSTWAGAALGLAGIMVGVIASRSTAPPPQIESAGGVTRPSIRKVSVSVSSIPVGADIYRVGDDTKKIGQTDTYLDFELSDDARISLVFRKEGYLEETREVSPYPIMVLLKPAPAPSRTGSRFRAPPSPPAQPVTPVPPPPGEPTGTRPSAPPRERERERPHARSSPPEGRPRPSELVDPFSK
jgi:serine/threonine protein kinase